MDEVLLLLELLLSGFAAPTPGSREPNCTPSPYSTGFVAWLVEGIPESESPDASRRSVRATFRSLTSGNTFDGRAVGMASGADVEMTAHWSSKRSEDGRSTRIMSTVT